MYARNSFDDDDDDDESKYVVENVHNLGPHTLQLQVVLNESGSTIYAGKSLPSHQIKFTITGLPECHSGFHSVDHYIMYM